MSIEIFDCLKRERDICVKTIIPSQNTEFRCIPALSGTKLTNSQAYTQILMTEYISPDCHMIFDINCDLENVT